MLISPRAKSAGAALLGGLALGAAGGYAVSASAAGTSDAGPTTTHRTGHTIARLRRAVSLSAVVPGPDGHFSTLTLERGTLTSISGDNLTLDEGSGTASYRSVPVTVPAGARVRLSGKPTTLSALKSGERVTIVQGPRRTTVIARATSATSPTDPGSSR